MAPPASRRSPTRRTSTSTTRSPHPNPTTPTLTRPGETPPGCARDNDRSRPGTLRILSTGTASPRRVDHALNAWRDVDDRYGEAVTLDHRGQVLHELGQAETAGSSWHQALMIFENLSDPHAADLRARLHVLGATSALPNNHAC
jgi:hypothetical protein